MIVKHVCPLLLNIHYETEWKLKILETFAKKMSRNCKKLEFF